MQKLPALKNSWLHPCNKIIYAFENLSIMVDDKKMFLIKIVQKSRKQTIKQKQKNQGKKKIRQKENKAKKSIK